VKEIRLAIISACPSDNPVIQNYVQKYKGVQQSINKRFPEATLKKSHIQVITAQNKCRWQMQRALEKCLKSGCNVIAIDCMSPAISLDKIVRRFGNQLDDVLFIQSMHTTDNLELFIVEKAELQLCGLRAM